jgi:hypothetical protein
MMQSQTSLADGTGSGLLSTHSSNNDEFRSSLTTHGRVGCSGFGRLGADVVAPRLMSVRPSDCWFDAAWPARSDVMAVVLPDLRADQPKTCAQR